MNQWWPGPPLRATTPGRRPDPSGWPRLRRPKKPALLAGEEACERSDRPTRDTPPPKRSRRGNAAVTYGWLRRRGRADHPDSAGRPSALHPAHGHTAAEATQGDSILAIGEHEPSWCCTSAGLAKPAEPFGIARRRPFDTAWVQCPWCLPGVCALLIPHTAQLGHSGAERPEHPRGSHPSFRLTLFGAASRGPLALRRVRTHPPG